MAELIALHDRKVAKATRVPWKDEKAEATNVVTGFMSNFEDEIKKSLDKDISQDTYKRILSYAKNTDNPLIIQRIISKIDRLVPLSEWINQQFEKVTGEVEIESLNSNCEKTGIVLVPNLSPALYAGAYRDSAFERISDAGNCLRYTYYYYKKDVKEKVVHHLLKLEVKTAASIDSDEPASIKVALAPICPGTVNAVFSSEDIKNMENGVIRIKDLKDAHVKNVIKNRVKAAIIEAGKNCADILVFPEMLGTAELIETYKYNSEEFGTLLDKMYRKRLDLPQLIFFPTYENDCMNIAYIFNGSGYLIAKQHKQHGYRNKDSNGSPGDEIPDEDNFYEEDLSNKEETIHILHIGDVGRIVTTICYDFLTAAYLDKLARVLRVSFFVTPACTKGMENFKISAAGIIQYNAHMVMVNSSSLFTDNKIEGRKTQNFVAAAIPICDSGYIKGVCSICSKCSKGYGDGCIFLIDLPLNSKRYAEDIEHSTKAGVKFKQKACKNKEANDEY